MGTAALLIDFGGTLDADGEPWNERFYQAYRSGGGQVGRPQFLAAFSVSDERLANLAGAASLDYSETVAAQAELLRPLLIDGTVLTDPSLQAALVDAACAVAARNRPVLEDLATRFRLAVVSNYQGNLGPCLSELGLDGMFDVVSDSAVIGVRKPDPRIFAVTLDDLGCNIGNAWMIGDSPPNDILAAAALGIRTCWVAPATRLLADIRPTARIARFVDLPNVVDRCTD